MGRETSFGEHSSRLGLAVEDWAALYPVPVLLTAWSDGRLTPDESFRARTAVADATRLYPNQGPTIAERGKLPVDLMLDGRQRPGEREQLQLAQRLLCWHFAKDLTPDERSSRLSKLYDLCDRTFQRHSNVDEVFHELRATIDDYLPGRQFETEANVAHVPEPEVRLAWLPEVQSWHPLVVTPLAELVNAAPARDRESLRSELDRELASKERDKTSALGALPQGRAWWRNVFQNLTTVPPQTAAERVAEAHRFLAIGLSSIEYRQREGLLQELEELGVNATRPGLFGRSLGGENVAPLFAQLRSEVEQVRAALTKTAAPSGGPDSKAAEEATQEVSGAPAKGSDLPPSAPPRVDAGEGSSDQNEMKPTPTVPKDRFAPAEREPEPPPPRPPTITLVPDATTIAWEECLAYAQDITVDDIEELLEGPFVFEEHLHEGESVVVVPDGVPLPGNLWFVGDLHCDLLALAATWEFIRTQDASAGPPHVVFLGDVIDRGFYGYETLLYLFRLIRDHGGQVGVLPGNHDEFSWDETAGRFRSPVQPAETIDQFNDALASREESAQKQVAVGRHAARFFAERPRAIFLPDGLLVAHGGFPHEDLLPALDSRAALNAPECLKDFVWLRFSTARRRRVNRALSGCEFGRQNFSDFCQVASKRLGVPVARMVRGHDHVPDRYRVSDDWGYPVLTINAMCRPLESEYGVGPRPTPVVARYIPGELPQLYLLKLSEQEIERAYGGGADEVARGEGTLR